MLVERDKFVVDVQIAERMGIELMAERMFDGLSWVERMFDFGWVGTVGSLYGSSMI